MKITKTEFASMIPSNLESEEWHDISLVLFPKYDIETKNRIAGFMAQCAHESSDFRVLEENLRYSSKRLLEIFPRYFKDSDEAKEFHYNPEKIANRVYNDSYRKYKLGNIQPGDGWRFRGRGLIQITGRKNYTLFGESIGLTAEEAARYCETKSGAFESACWFWNVNNINLYCDSNDIVGMTKRINGGTHGLTDRRARYEKNKNILEDGNETNFIVKLGSKGDLVRRIQSKFKITEDGDFGRITESAVKSWQRINRYTPNGILTQEQLEKLL